MRKSKNFGLLFLLFTKTTHKLAKIVMHTDLFFAIGPSSPYFVKRKKSLKQEIQSKALTVARGHRKQVAKILATGYKVNTITLGPNL
jgi:hypothetical protein